MRHTQRCTHLAANHQILIRHHQLFPGSAGRIEKRPPHRAHVVEVVRVEARQRQLPQREICEIAPGHEIPLAVGAGYIGKTAMFVNIGADGFRRHADGGRHAGISIQHPLHRQISLDNQAANIGLELFHPVQLQAALEGIPLALDHARFGRLLQYQPALNGVARHPCMNPLHAAVDPVHTADVEDRRAQFGIDPHLSIQIAHPVFRRGTRAGFAAAGHSLIRQRSIGGRRHTGKPVIQQAQRLGP